METEKEIIKRLIDEYTGDDLAGHICEQLAQIRSTQIMIKKISEERAAEEDRHKAKLAGFDNQLRQVQEKCRHLSRTYHPDPSGNNDSYYECDHCRKTL